MYLTLPPTLDNSVKSFELSLLAHFQLKALFQDQRKTETCKAVVEAQKSEMDYHQVLLLPVRLPRAALIWKKLEVN